MRQVIKAVGVGHFFFGGSGFFFLFLHLSLCRNVESACACCMYVLHLSPFVAESEHSCTWVGTILGEKK